MEPAEAWGGKQRSELLLPRTGRSAASFSSFVPQLMWLTAGTTTGGYRGDHSTCLGGGPRKGLCKILVHWEIRSNAKHRSGKENRLSPQFAKIIFVPDVLIWNYIVLFSFSGQRKSRARC